MDINLNNKTDIQKLLSEEVNEITLNVNGKEEVVKINTRPTIKLIKQAKLEGLFPKNVLAEMAGLKENPFNINDDYIEGAAYIAYKAANPNGYSKEEFEEYVQYDILTNMRIYSQLISGSFGNNFSKNFNNAARLNSSKKNSGSKSKAKKSRK